MCLCVEGGECRHNVCKDLQLSLITCCPLVEFPACTVLFQSLHKWEYCKIDPIQIDLIPDLVASMEPLN